MAVARTDRVSGSGWCILTTKTEVRRCYKCRLEKPVGAFNASQRTGRQGYCRECGNESARANYEANKDRYFAHARRRSADLKARVREAKARPCADCGGTFDPVCMDFDHLPGFEKAADVCTMIRRKMAWAKIAAEIAKCEVVCANCHRIRTRDRADSDAQGVLL